MGIFSERMTSYFERSDVIIRIARGLFHVRSVNMFTFKSVTVLCTRFRTHWVYLSCLNCKTNYCIKIFNESVIE
jgi:hypothetical protein